MRPEKYLLLVLTVWIALVMASCAPFEPAGRLPQKELTGQAYSGGDSHAEPLNRWWESFGDSQLTALVEEALASNFTLQQSWARLEQARALAVKTGASLVPELSLDAGASVNRQGGPAMDETAENYALGLSSSYEIDLWGRIRSERQAAVLSVAASREDLNAAAVTLAANVVTRWIGVISQRMQKDLLQAQLKVNQTLLELVELRFRKSLVSALDVFQQRQLVAQSRAQLPLVEQTERELLNELALLLGRAPFAAPGIDSSTLNVPADVPATGIPAQLLEYRPDIRGAMRRLEAADWNVAVARADRLPALSLTARAAYQSDEVSLLFDNWLLNLAGNLTAPLLDGGRRKAEVRRQLAVVEEQLAAYSQLVLTAMREVEDALVREKKLREHYIALEAQLDAAQKALYEARSRYRSGLNDYLPVLTQLLSVQSLERTRIQRKAELLVARVDLHRALGGTWTATLTPRRLPDPN